MWVYYLEYKEDILNTHVSYVFWIAELTMNTINVEYVQIKREILTPGSHNILYEPLVDRKESFNATIAYQMRYGKTLYEITKGRWSNFCLLREIFPKHTAAKMFSSLWYRPSETRDYHPDPDGWYFHWSENSQNDSECWDFAESMSISQKSVWDSFWAVVDGFLGNRKYDRYFIPCLTPSSVKKWQKREFPISQKIFSSQKNENNSHDQCTLENHYQQKNCEC